jgi:hypothetical protein
VTNNPHKTFRSILDLFDLNKHLLYYKRPSLKLQFTTSLQNICTVHTTPYLLWTLAIKSSPPAGPSSRPIQTRTIAPANNWHPCPPHNNFFRYWLICPRCHPASQMVNGLELPGRRRASVLAEGHSQEACPKSGTKSRNVETPAQKPLGSWSSGRSYGAFSHCINWLPTLCLTPNTRVVPHQPLPSLSDRPPTSSHRPRLVTAEESSRITQRA